MSESVEQISIVGVIVASHNKILARFDTHKINLSASASSPLLLIFSVNYSWEEQRDDKWDDWDLFMIITDEEGDILHSEQKHFGEDKDSYKNYPKEGDNLRYYKTKNYKKEDRLKKGEGVMAWSLNTPSHPRIYTYKCKHIAQFWEREIGEDAGLEKNKTKESDECLVSVSVK